MLLMYTHIKLGKTIITNVASSNIHGFKFFFEKKTLFLGKV